MSVRGLVLATVVALCGVVCYQLAIAREWVWLIAFGVFYPVIGIRDYLAARRESPPQADRMLMWLLAYSFAAVVLSEWAPVPHKPDMGDHGSESPDASSLNVD